MVNSDDGIKTEASIDYDMDTWESVERLPSIFPVNIPTCLKLSTTGQND